MKHLFTITAITLLLFSAIPLKTAHAQCETPLEVNGELAILAADASQLMNRYLGQSLSFFTKSFGTVTYMTTKRIKELEGNIQFWIDDWFDSKFEPSLKDMTEERNVAQIVQNMNTGKMMDAQLLNKSILERQIRKVEAKRRYEPSELACQVDTLGPGKTKAYQASTALANSTTQEDTLRRGNARGTPAATGRLAEISSQWDEYQQYFCNKARGDAGCERETPSAGDHKDFAGMMWGQRQSFDFSNPNERRATEAAIRYLVYPATSDPIAASSLGTSAAKEEFLRRRSEMARTNVLYNTLNRMVAERVGGTSGADVSGIRQAAGISLENTTTNASYRELQEAMARDRFLDTNYAIHMAGSPEQVIREQVSIGATRLQLMGDIYRRQEELLLINAADYSRDLDYQMPGSATAGASIQ